MRYLELRPQIVKVERAFSVSGHDTEKQRPDPPATTQMHIQKADIGIADGSGELAGKFQEDRNA